MHALVLTQAMRDEQDEAILAAVDRERPRLRGWLRRYLDDPAEIEDLVQDVFYELVLAYRIGQPLRDAGAWLFRVARNRAIDLLRRRRSRPGVAAPVTTDEGDSIARAELLPSPAAGPGRELVRSRLVDELAAALDELPREQREVFLAHEVEGLSFAEISARTGIGVNTLLSRKHYAVLKLRERLRDIHEQIDTDWEESR